MSSDYAQVLRHLAQLANVGYSGDLFETLIRALIGFKGGPYPFEVFERLSRESDYEYLGSVPKDSYFAFLPSGKMASISCGPKKKVSINGVPLFEDISMNDYFFLPEDHFCHRLDNKVFIDNQLVKELPKARRYYFLSNGKIYSSIDESHFLEGMPLPSGMRYVITRNGCLYHVDRDALFLENRFVRVLKKDELRDFDFLPDGSLFYRKDNNFFLRDNFVREIKEFHDYNFLPDGRLWHRSYGNVFLDGQLVFNPEWNPVRLFFSPGQVRDHSFDVEIHNYSFYKRFPFLSAGFLSNARFWIVINDECYISKKPLG